MRKSNYLILSPLFLIFNDDLTKLNDTKESSQLSIYVLDLERFDNLKIIESDLFCFNCTVLYLPNNVENIKTRAFTNFEFVYSNIYKCKQITYINQEIFYNNKIKQLKLPDNIISLSPWAFKQNNIERLDFRNCKNLKNIELGCFSENPLKLIIIPNDIDIDYYKTWDYENDPWNDFAKYYCLINHHRGGAYTYIKNRWNFSYLKYDKN